MHTAPLRSADRLGPVPLDRETRNARRPAAVAPSPGETHAATLPDNDCVPVVVVPLDRETRSAIDTATAAYHLGRQPQTLRIWASRQCGPIQPIRVHGRLAWPVAEIRSLLGVKC